jgi:hypothetical protein
MRMLLGPVLSATSTPEKGQSYLLESRENHLELLVLLLDGLLQSSHCLCLGSSHLFRGTLLGGDSLGDAGVKVDEGLQELRRNVTGGRDR